MNQQKWEKLLQREKSSIFQTKEWVDALTNKDWKPVYLVNDDYTGGMVLMTNGKSFESMPYGGYGGFIGEPVNYNKLLSIDTGYIRIADYHNTLGNEWEKMQVSTYLLEIHNFKESHSVHDNLRIANKYGLIVKESPIDEWIKVFHKCYGRFDIAYSRDFLQRVRDNLGDKAKFLGCYKGEDLIGVSLQLFYKKEIFNLYNIGLDKKMQPVSLMMKYVIDNYPEYDTYNLGATSNENVANFKKNWGAKEYKYNICGKTFNLQYL